MGLTECRTIPLAPARPARPGGNIEVWCDGVRVARVRPRDGGEADCSALVSGCRFASGCRFICVSFPYLLPFPCGPLTCARSLLTPVVLSLPARPPPRRCPRLPRAARTAAAAASPVSSPHPSSHTCPPPPVRESSHPPLSRVVSLPSGYNPQMPFPCTP